MEKFTRRTNVFKRAFTRYKRRRLRNRYQIYKNPAYQELKVRGEYMDAVYCPGLGNTYLHQNNGFQYMNFYSLMSQMGSIQNMFTEFEMYKIYGASVEVMPCQDSYGVSFTYGAPCISIGINPVEVSVTLGSTSFTNDTSVVAYLNQKSPSRKYFSYPDNFYNGVVLGIGTWNRTDSFSSQVGQFATFMPDANTNLSGSQVYLYTVKYQLYIVLKQRAK